MGSSTLQIVQAVMAGLAVFLLLHVAIWRAAPSNAPRIMLLGLLAAVGTGSSVLGYRLLGGAGGTALCAIVGIDAFAITLYLFVYAGVARSVSVTLLSRLLHCAGGSLDFETLVDEYTASLRFEDRIQLMRRSGLVRVSGGSVRLTRKGIVLSRGAKWVGRLTCSDLDG